MLARRPVPTPSLTAAAVSAVVLLGLEALAEGGALGTGSFSGFVGDWGYHLLMAASAAMVLLRVALIPDQRVAWGLIGFGLVAWNIGDIYYAVVVAGGRAIPYPSPSDAFYFALYVGLLGGLRVMGGKVHRSGPVSLSLAVSVLGMASVWSWLVFGGVLGTAEGKVAAVATTAAYPLLDLLLLASALIALAARDWRLDRTFTAMIIGFTSMAVGDLIYASQISAGTYVDGTVLDAMWPAGALAIAFAAWLPAGKSHGGISGERLLPVLTTSAASVAAGILIWDHFDTQETITVILAGATLTLGLLQLLLLFRERSVAQSEALAVEALRNASIEAALDCIITIDARGRVCEWNDAARLTFGHRTEDAVGRDIADLIIPPEQRETHRAGLETACAGGAAPILGQRIEVMAQHARGGTFPVELAVTRVQENPPMFTAFIRDISGRRHREEENERLAAIVRSSEDAILSKDLNGVVTAWNRGAEELYGYTAAEAIGTSIEDLIIPPDRAGEAAEITRGVTAGESAALTVQRLTKEGELREVALRAFPIRNLAGDVIGVSASAHDITERRRLEERERLDTEQKLWRRRIKASLANDHFHFWGQPVVDVRTGEIDHHELLLRMDFEGRTIAPNMFLPHAESSELITEIDHWAITRGIDLGRRSPVAINLSAKSLANPRLIDQVGRCLTSAGIPSRNVMFEITETAAAENLDAARTLVEQLRTMGCGVALDDFGTGYGSFTYLKHLPVTELKIDMSFIRGLVGDEADRRVVRSIIMVATNFEMKTVAEGVEDAETLELLCGMGVDLVQGYHLGYPRPMEGEADPRIAERSPGIEEIALARAGD